jgi:Uri superfamily endonuclease
LWSGWYVQTGSASRAILNPIPRHAK